MKLTCHPKAIELTVSEIPFRTYIIVVLDWYFSTFIL